LGGKWFLAKGLFLNVINVPWCCSMSIHILQGCSPPLMVAPQVEAAACPTQRKKSKTYIYGSFTRHQNKSPTWNTEVYL